MILFNFVLWQSNNYLTKKAVINNSSQTSNFLNNLINTDLQKIYSGTTNLESTNNFTLKVDKSTLDVVQIDKLSNIIEESTSEEYRVIFYFEGVIYYNDLWDYTSRINQLGYFYYILDNNGLIINSIDDDKFSKEGLYLKDFYDISDNFDLVGQFKFRTNSKYFISSVNFQGFNFIQIVEKSSFQITNTIKIFAISTSIIFLLAVIALFIYTYIKEAKKINNDDKLKLNDFIISKYQYFYKAIIDESGYFISYNDMFKDQFIKNDETKISQFNVIIDDESNQEEFLIEHLGEEFVFSYFEYHKKYVLVGEKRILSNNNSSEVSSHTHPVTLLPNIRGFESYIETLLKTDRKTFVSINIENYTSLMIEHAQEKLNSAVLEVSNILKETITNKETKLFHTSNSSFMVSYDIEEGSTLTTEWYLDFIKKIVDRTYRNTNLILRFKIGILDTNEELLETPLTFYFNIRELQSKTKLIYPNTVLYYDEKIQEEIFKSNELIKDIEKGIINDEFEIYLQPKVSLSNKRIYSYEALLRWNNDKYKNISPLTYIKKAEESDLIFMLGRCINEKVIKIINEFNNPNLLISINISVKQFSDKHFANDLFSLMDKYNVKTSQVALELTETVLANSLIQTKESIMILRNAGIKIYLDDFGTGYSSLQYLKDLDVDVLKIDRSFINSCVDDRRVLAITKSIVEMAHELNISVIAEGVETYEQYKIMEDIKVDTIQGYLVSKPLKAQEALMMFNKEHKFKKL